MPNYRLKVGELSLLGTHASIWDYSGSNLFLLLHGAFTHAEAWDRWLEFFGKMGAKALALDAQGHGKSSFPLGQATLKGDVAAAENLLEQLKTPGVVIVGHSKGGYLAQRVAEKLPTRVRGLVLLNSVCPVEKNVTDAFNILESLTLGLECFLLGTAAPNYAMALRAVFNTLTDDEIEAAFKTIENESCRVIYELMRPPDCAVTNHDALIFVGDQDRVLSRLSQLALVHRYGIVLKSFDADAVPQPGANAFEIHGGHALIAGQLADSIIPYVFQWAKGKL